MKQKLLLLLLVVLSVLPALARDFEYTYEGQTLTYTVINEDAKTCQTKYRTDFYGNLIAGNEVKGRLILPKNPKDGDVEYTLIKIASGAFYKCHGLTSVSIPNSVTSIGSYAFYECYGLTSVVIPNSVTYLGDGAFGDCRGVIKSAYPSTFEKPFPFEKPFYYGRSITYDPKEAITEDGWIWGPEKSAIYFAPLSLEGEYSIPESVSSIGKNAFYSCSGLTSVVIPNSVTSIGENAFEDCSGLIKCAYPSNLSNPFPEGTTIIDYNPKGAITEDGWIWGPDKSAIYFVPLSFKGEYSVPESVNSIGDYAFKSCSGMTSLEIGNNVTSIGSYAFHRCSSLTSVKALPVSPAEMKVSSFQGLYDTVELSVPEEVTNHYLATNWSLFKNIRNNSGIELGYFSDGVLEYRLNPADMTATVIGAKSYSNLQIPERFSDDTDASNPVRYIIKGIGYNAFNDKGVSTVEFNSRCKIEYIGGYAFAGGGFSSIILPETVSYIGESAFRNSSIRSITIPENVKEINDYTFYNCTSLTDVRLNGTLESIGESAFSMDESKYYINNRYGSIVIPASLKSVGVNAFRYRELDKVTISDIRAWCDIDFSNHNSNPCLWANEGFWLGENEIVDLEIPNGVSEIKPFSFATVGKIKSVTMPSSVTSIGEEAFYYNYNLASIDFSDNLKTIGDRAFCYCPIPDVSIPCSVEYIGHKSFIAWDYPSGYTSSFTKYLKTFTLEEGPDTIEIEVDAFTIPTSISGDNQVRYNTPEIFYMGRPMEKPVEGLNTTLRNLTVGNTVESVSDGLFANCTRLNDLKLGNSIQSIGDQAFSGCTSLAEVILPPSVETIGASTFAGNSKLESIIMGHKVKSIGEKAFDGCKANTVSITAQTPPTAPNNTFSNYSGKLYLQGEKAKDVYYDALTCWDRFDSYVMIDAEEIKIEGADKISGKAGDTFQLTATVWPENVTLPQIFWRATNPEIATVDANGLVTLHVDLESLKTRAQGEGDIDGACTIIAETLYNDGPVAQVAVDENGLNAVESIPVGDNGIIDYTLPYEIYNMNGLKVSNSTEGLAKGIYIIRQGKAAVKTVVR